MKHYDVDGSLAWVDGPGYCSECDREWKAMGEAHCVECHRHFTSDSGFDAHRRDSICLSPRSLKKKSGKLVFESTGRASGQAWKLRSETPHPFASKPEGDEFQAVSA